MRMRISAGAKDVLWLRAFFVSTGGLLIGGCGIAVILMRNDVETAHSVVFSAIAIVGMSVAVFGVLARQHQLKAFVKHVNHPACILPAVMASSFVKLVTHALGQNDPGNEER